MDGVALASVITSGVVGLGSLGTQAWLADRSEKAEVRKEARRCLVDLSRWCTQLNERLAPRLDERTIAAFFRSPDLDAQLGVYAKPDLRHALVHLDTALRALERELLLNLAELDEHRRTKESALDARALEAATDAREKEMTVQDSMKPQVEAAQRALTVVRTHLIAD